LFDVSLWRDISLVILAIEIMIGLAPILVLLYFCVKYVPQGTHWLRHFFSVLRGTMDNVQIATLKTGRSIISPFIAIRQFVAAGKGMIRGALTVTRGK
jgi:hypothetical protein